MTGDRLIRLIRTEGMENLELFLQSESLRPFHRDGSLIGTRRLEPDEVPELDFSGQFPAAVEHDVIPFASYPYEWPPEMLFDAARLTLGLAEAGADHGIGLKDAKPDNIMFRGPTPVFVDALSFEKRHPKDPIWLAAAQFTRTFLLPLLAHNRFGLPIAQSLQYRSDGLEPQEIYRLCGPLRRLLPPCLGLVTLPTLLARFAQDSKIYERRLLDSEDKAKFILRSAFTRLKRKLEGLRPPTESSSHWSTYMEDKSYSDAGFTKKEAFIISAAEEFKPRTALDVGCNDGHFSRILAERGSSVVAIDLDPVVVGKAWRMAKEKSLDILPLVQDLSRPSPATGWLNRERAAFLSRTRKRFDLVIMLAVIHHMMVSAGIPLDDILELAADMTTDQLIVEYVGREDVMFRRICRGREDLYDWFDPESFEAACGKRFEIVRIDDQDSQTRKLYLLRLKKA